MGLEAAMIQMQLENIETLLKHKYGVLKSNFKFLAKTISRPDPQYIILFPAIETFWYIFRFPSHLYKISKTF